MQQVELDAGGSQPLGRVFWITGLSGAGKTTVGEKLWSRLRQSGRHAVFLDGDELRNTIGDDVGHRAEDRRRLGLRYGRLCRLLTAQGIDVVCATISMFHEVRERNRESISDYIEIYLRVPFSELERRDPKGIYAEAKRNRLTDIVGVDLAAEEPTAPNLVIDNYGGVGPERAVDLIWHYVNARPRSANTGSFNFCRSKAETLEYLEPKLRMAKVLPQIRFTVGEWRSHRHAILDRITTAPWGGGRLIVRSSACSEDLLGRSSAGKYASVLDVVGAQRTACAIDRVVSSFDGENDGDQVFVQPFLGNVSLAGVAFNREPSSSGPYVIINYDTSGRTDRVTSGNGEGLRTYLCLRAQRDLAPTMLVPVLDLLREIETILEWDGLDVEFAITTDGEVFLLQARPLVIAPPSRATDKAVERAVDEIACKLALLSRPHPYLHGKRSVFGVMPDWNPAEMIGLRPKPLALTLYQDLVTDSIWAYQRDNYGYKNLRSFPLMVSFHGLPYIDVRVSFNSFLPNDVEPRLADRLINYYIERLAAQPALHDKVEFEVIFSCYTLDLPTRIKTLHEFGFSAEDVTTLSASLRRLTNRIIHGETGLWQQDRKKINLLTERLRVIRTAPIDKISRIYWLIEDCKRYGTLPFAGLARAGFIAVQLLRSLVTTGVLDEAEYVTFLANLDTVGSRIGRDFAALSREQFLERYGHLRPGTYDILSPRYDEAPDLYFDWSAPRPPAECPPRFALSVAQLRQIERLLKEHGLEHDVLGFIDFIKTGIESREYAKFVFSNSLSDALSLINQLAQEHGIPPADCAYLDFTEISVLYREAAPIGARLRDSIARGKELHSLTRRIVLPPLLTAPDDAYSFHLPPTEPNFVTAKSVTAPVLSVADAAGDIGGKIVFIPSADPGFDWIFTRGIRGFVTQFGGINSHMAIRAGELGVPAVIGAGEALYQRWLSAKVLSLDCSNRHVEIVT